LKRPAWLYRELIARHPDNADALHLFGVLRAQGGDMPPRPISSAGRPL